MFPYDTNGIDNDLIKKMMSGTQQNQPSEEHTVKVNGIDGARALNLAPNSDKLVLDQNEPIVWFIQTDGSGSKNVVGYDISLHEIIKPEDILKNLDARLTRIEEVLRNGKSYTGPNSKPAKSGNANYDAGVRSNDKG